MTTQTYESKAKQRREELKTISNPLKPLVLEGAYETLNAAIIEEVYKKDGNTVFKTFEQWKKDGFSIAKGSQAFVVWGKPRQIGNKETKEGEEDEKNEFFPICYLFSNKQVYKRTEEPTSSEVREEEVLYKTFHEIEVKYNPGRSISMPETLRGSKDAQDALRPLFEEFIQHREAFAILLLNQANRILGFATISTGGICGTVADPRIIFQHALMGNACGIILCHNHPSGSLKPSSADINLTKKLKEGAELLDMRILDHIILTESSYASFADEGWM